MISRDAVVLDSDMLDEARAYFDKGAPRDEGDDPLRRADFGA